MVIFTHVPVRFEKLLSSKDISCRNDIVFPHRLCAHSNQLLLKANFFIKAFISAPSLPVPNETQQLAPLLKR
jgi:hypothetical protein